MAMEKSGMMVAFSDLKKVYDTVNRENMLDCLEQRGRLGVFLEELYRRIECEVGVDEVLSDPIELTTVLRQGYVLSLLLFSL